MQTEVIEEFRKGLTEIKDGITNTEKNVTDLTAGMKKLQEENDRLQAEFTKVRRLHLSRTAAGITAPSPGMVSDQCAAELGSRFVLHCARSGKLEILSHSAATRDALLTSSLQTLGLEVRTALTTTDIPF